jgi:hypothetical protein
MRGSLLITSAIANELSPCVARESLVSDDKPLEGELEVPEAAKGAMIARGALNTIGGAIPFAGGFLSAVASVWGEKEQEHVNRFLEHWQKMLTEEMKEKEKTIIEIMSRLDMHDEEISKRVESSQYQSLLRKAFRDWAGAESEQKRVMVRNLLVNAAASKLTSDDVVNLFLKWIKDYSEFHFEVIGAIYNHEIARQVLRLEQSGHERGIFFWARPHTLMEPRVIRSFATRSHGDGSRPFDRVHRRERRGPWSAAADRAE